MSYPANSHTDPWKAFGAAMGPRRIGAIAGLAPASIVVVLFVIFGSPALTREVIVPLVGITVLAVVDGWLVGPIAAGSFRADLTALVAYALVAALLYLVIGAVGTVWTETAAGGVSDVWAVAGPLLYGLLYVPFWAGFVAPFALAWVVVVRILRRRARLLLPEPEGSGEPGGSNQLQRIRPRRLGLVAAALVLGYGLFVALLPLMLYNDPRPPWWIYRPIALFGLFAVPAAVAAIGTLRRVKPLLIVAGVLCLLQAYIAFSGVTLGFMVPAVVLLWLGAAGSRSSQEVPPIRSVLIAGVAIIGLTVAAWVSLFALTEPRCWVGVQTADGTISVVEVPATDTMLYGPSEIPSGGSGCSSAELTVQGIGVSAVLAIGAIAFAGAAAAASAGRRTDDA